MGKWTERAQKSAENSSRARASAKIAEIGPGLPEAPISRKPAPDPLFPPRVRWSQYRGYLNVRDPFTGEWHCIAAREAPTGYAALATAAKYSRSS